jgi:hypothetical protein
LWLVLQELLPGPYNEETQRIWTPMSEKYRTNPFFNGVSTFKTAFPMLSDALIEWQERRGPEDSRGGDTRRTGYKRGNFTQGVLPCSNPACHEGGYQVDRLVAEMITLGENERTGMMLCSGRETGDEVRRGPIRCPYRIEYKVSLTPRGGEEEPERRRRNRRHRGRPSGRSSAA